MTKPQFIRINRLSIENYLKMAIQNEYHTQYHSWDSFIHSCVEMESRELYTLAYIWFTKQTQEDQEFLRFIFDQGFYEGFYTYIANGNETKSKSLNYEINKTRYLNLEERFAIDSELIEYGEGLE